VSIKPLLFPNVVGWVLGSVLLILLPLYCMLLSHSGFGTQHHANELLRNGQSASPVVTKWALLLT